MTTWLLASRSRVLFGTIGLLLVLDLGRSINARVAYSHPRSRWNPGANSVEVQPWPPERGVPAGAPLGQRVYIARCAFCHGWYGHGNGPATASLHPKPRDFEGGEYKYKTTPAGVAATERDLSRVIANGLVASAMPPWRDVLSDAELDAVRRYVVGLGKRPLASDADSLAIPPRVTPDSASRARGRALYASLGCVACHGADGRLELRVADSRGDEIRARDLSAPWTFRGGSAPEQLWLRITTGIAGTPMPSYAALARPEQRWDVVNFVISLRRTPPWEPGGTFGGPGTSRDPIRRGEYLARAEMCGLCHTATDITGIYRAGLGKGQDRWLAGGMRVIAYPQGVFITRNLTSDSATGIGRFTPAQLAEAIRNGRRPRGGMLNVFAMPWLYLHSFSQDDALAIARFLKTVPPVSNLLPGPLHYGVLETVAQKLWRGLPQGRPTVLAYEPGPYGDVPGHLSLAFPQRVLVWLQWAILIVGAVLYFMAGHRSRRTARGEQRWLLPSIAWLVVVAVAIFGAVVYAMPSVSFISADRIAQLSVPYLPDTARIADRQVRAMVTRGRYLYTVTSCAMCHQEHGQGGWKINWRTAFGTIYVQNISSDSATGIGAWTDAEIARAIRGGVERGGRALHWQGMIWDHLSNLDEEDVRAIISYLRYLPPVRNLVRPPRPPAPDDCDDFVFWVGPDGGSGCR